jgi:beta-lactamase regulating signal transducer with metallopeptidase domain
MSGMESGDWVAYGAVVVAKVTVLLLCAYGASWLLRGRPAAVRHAVWAAAVAGVVALPLLGAAFPSLRVAVPLPGWVAAAERIAASAMAAGAVDMNSSPSPPGSALAVATGSAESARPVGSGVVPVGAADPGAVSPFDPVATGQGSRALPVSGVALLLMAWLAGVLAVLSYTLLSMLHVWLLARRARELRDMRVLARAHGIASELGVTRPVEVLEGEPDAMPMTFGVLTDTLLLPASAKTWSTARLEGVLRHELAHIRRRDSLTQLIAAMGCALYWFHPGVWLAARRLRVEREHACDDVVLLAGARASDYARELLEIARTMRAGPALARASLSMAQPSRLRRRLVAVLDDRPRAARLPGTMLVPLGTAALALVMMLAAVTPSVASPAQEPTGSIAADTVPAPVAPAPPSPGLAPPAAPAPPPVAPAPPPGLAPPAPPVPRPPGLAARPAPDPPPFGLASPPAAPAPVAPGVQDGSCWGRFTGVGTVLERDGGSQRVRTIQKTLGDVQLCMRTSGHVELDATDGAIRSLGPGALVVLATRAPSRDLHLEIRPAREGLEHAWYVDGERRPFDAAAAEWRDALLDLLHAAGEIASIRGQVASLRGEIASVRGRRASLRGEIASIRGREASLRGEMASVRGRMASMRGEIASIRGREASMRGEVASIRGRGGPDADARVAAVERRIAEYDAPRRVREVEDRIRGYDADGAIRAIEARAAGLDTASLIAEVEARLAALDVDGEVARIEARIQAHDAAGRVAGLQARMGSQEQRLLESLRRIR